MAMIPCNICSEKGTVSQGRACPVCDGAGEIEAPDGFHMSVAHQIAMYRMLLDIMLPTNVFYSHMIWEATDLTEFTALSADNKDAYRGIVRMGTVSLVDGSHSRNSLWDMFDAESTTRAALLALLT